MLLAESRVLAKLAQLKHSLLEIDLLAVRSQHQQLTAYYDSQLQALSQSHGANKQRRDEQRSHAHQSLTGKALASYLLTLQQESQQDGLEKRRLKQERATALLPLERAIAQQNKQLQQLKQQYTTMSASWQTHVQQTYFAALAKTDRATLSLPVIYEDDDLLVIDKPAGLLSVPGRRVAQQDSVISRLRYLLPQCSFLQAVHRLDQATSGLLIVALTPFAHRALSQQFSQRQVRKSYEAVLSNPITNSHGVITLPLRAHAQKRPMQVVDWQQGKPSQTEYEVIMDPCTPGERQPRVRLVPQTGRTHQLRVHAAHADGLAAPILGDQLYGQSDCQSDCQSNESAHQAARLHLHATGLEFLHPVGKNLVALSSQTPF